MSVSPSRPYLLRGLFEWLNDNELTPHIVVNAGHPGVIVPLDYVQDGQITLNISPGAVRNLLLDNTGVSFNARFGGVPMDVFVPIAAVLAIYARENGQGMGFGMEPGADVLATGGSDPEPEPPEPGPGGGRPSLRVVK